MLDMNWIREHREEVQRAADGKGIRLSVGELLAADERRRRLLKEVEQLRHARNELSREAGIAMRAGDDERAEEAKRRARGINERLAALEVQEAEAKRQVHELMLLVPNIVSPDTPDGASDADNIEIRRVGEPPVFDYKPLDHVELGVLHDMIDMPRGVKMAGSRSYVLKGAAAWLHRAVQQLALDHLAAKGFTLLEVPVAVRGEAFEAAGFFPLGKDQVYGITGENLWLAGTAEVPLVSLYSGETIDLAEPMRLAAASACFRSEVGSAGRDVHGLYRVHQFAKVEQVVLCRADPELAEKLLQDITANAEEILQMLELPYRVVAVCIGDMAQKTYKQFDIETWMPGRGAYGETHSSSCLLDFQARRANIRYRDADGIARFAYTLNNTAVATPRILIPLLENHQQPDGSIRIPKALRPYMQGRERLEPPGGGTV